MPYTWLDDYTDFFKVFNYEALAVRMGDNGMELWESYVAGCDPTDPDDKFLVTAIEADAKGVTHLDWTPNLTPDRVYTVLGKASLTDGSEWGVTNSATRYFKIQVAMPPPSVE